MRPRLLLTINCKFAVDFFARGRAVARLPLRQLGFLVDNINCKYCKITVNKRSKNSRSHTHIVQGVFRKHFVRHSSRSIDVATVDPPQFSRWRSFCVVNDTYFLSIFSLTLQYSVCLRTVPFDRFL